MAWAIRLDDASMLIGGLFHSTVFCKDAIEAVAGQMDVPQSLSYRF